MASNTVDVARPVTGGVDTHSKVNVAAALDGIGVASFATSRAGSEELVGRLQSYGTLTRVGVERHRLVWSGPVAPARRARRRRGRGRPPQPPGTAPDG